jgi:Ran GTPase-activating protein (RanGAP) involved in mRNA processing and transport
MTRKLLAPLLLLKVETAEIELQRVSLPNIRAFRIWNHRSLDLLVDAVADAGGPQILRSLERMALKACPLGPEVISSFILPAFSNTQLKHLNLEKNQVTDDVLCNLVNSGALDAGCLESMNLRFNRIGSKGVEALASSPCCASLKWVNLKMNSVGDDGAIALAEMLERNSSMSLLNLRRQTPALTDRSAVAFARMLKYNSALEQLRLRTNRIGDDGAMALAGEVADHVRRLQSFRGFGARFELDLEQNRIRESGATALLGSLSGISRAVRVELLLHGNPAKKEALAKADEGTDVRLVFESKAEGLLW